MAIQSKSQLRRLRNSFRQTTRNLQEAVQDANLKRVRARLRRTKAPVWVQVVRKIYHKYGLKHVLLILVFLAYQFLGACIFLFLEMEAEENKESAWKAEVIANRTELVEMLVPAIFNNSRYFFFPDGQQSEEIRSMMDELLTNFTSNYRPMTGQKIHWDFWNAMLYAGTICTTIGYGHLYPQTDLGKFMTMVYALFGIPLVLTILDDLGKLMTVALKYPWLGFKMAVRRLFRHCTGQTEEEIRRLDAEDKKWLPVFDLPIPVAVCVVVAWIFICSATFCIWEKDWDYFIAFYFFFVSLTTIGLGDVVPSEPKYLLMLFGYFIIGLSLVSMCVNLIQAKLERTYEAGKDESEMAETIGGASDTETGVGVGGANSGGPAMAALAMTAAGRVSLGVLRAGSVASSYSLSSVAPKSPIRVKRRMSTKVCQTLLSITSPGHWQRPPIPTTVNGPTETGEDKPVNTRLLPASISLDDVMKLVDTEETDLYILSQLCADRSEANLVKDIDAQDADGFMEDDWQTQLLSTVDETNRVHFRSSVSVFPSEQPASFSGYVTDLARLDEMSSPNGSPPSSHAADHHHRSTAAGNDSDDSDNDDNDRRPRRLQPSILRHLHLQRQQQQQQQQQQHRRDQTQDRSRSTSTTTTLGGRATALRSRAASDFASFGRRLRSRLGFGQRTDTPVMSSSSTADRRSLATKFSRRFTHAGDASTSASASEVARGTGAAIPPKKPPRKNARAEFLNLPVTSIEEPLPETDGEDDEDVNDLTPLDPKAPRHSCI